MKIRKIHKLNWKEIQSFYDTGKTWRDIVKAFNISFQMLTEASKLGLFHSLNNKKSIDLMWKRKGHIGKKHTEESKLKLSIARKKYLSENPTIASWKTNDKFSSIPCEKIKKELSLLNIEFIEELMPLIHKQRFFAADIAFPSKMIIFEINGAQHYSSDGKLKPYYQERHDLIEAEGWKVYEIPYHSAMSRNFINEFIMPILNGATNLTPPDFYIKGTKVESLCSCGQIKWKTSKLCRKCSNKIPRKTKIAYPRKEVFHYLIWNYSILYLSKLFNASDNAIARRCNYLGIDRPPAGYWNKMKYGHIIDYQI